MADVKGPSRTRKRRSRAELTQAFLEAGRHLSTATVVLHQALAEQLGLSSADHKYVGMLMETGPITAGELAELTGLTTGAVTGIIDRLERAGLVERVRDPHDRRRVIVQPREPDAESQRRAMEVFGPFGGAMAAFAAEFTVEELELLVRFMQRSHDVLLQEARNVRQRRPVKAEHARTVRSMMAKQKKG